MTEWVTAAVTPGWPVTVAAIGVVTSRYRCWCSRPGTPGILRKVM